MGRRLHRRAEEGVTDARRRRECDGGHGGMRERQDGEDGQPAEIGADHQPFAREAVDDRPEQEAEEDRRQHVGDEQRPDPPAGLRPVVDVDLERDDREPVADPRRERRHEEQPEAAVAEQREAGVQTPSHGCEA